MAYAPHTNTDVDRERISGDSKHPVVLGFFRNRASNAPFEFAERAGSHGDFAPEFDQVIYTLGGVRLARVLKTVVHVVVDEDDEGNPVVEVQKIKDRRDYDVSWVRPAK